MKKLFLFLLLAVLGTSSVRAQGDSLPSSPRKKVAVVLSGGGAKGMAHIGALRVIEKAGIPVDIITGTSMGSIIGGLYSIGYDSYRLDSMVRVQNWLHVLSDRDDVSDRSLSERKKNATYAFTKTINLQKKRSLATVGGAIQGKNLAALFDRLTVGYHDSMDFNRLPIPFACVATNIVDNTEYDFHHGVLSQAMRASMAIPGAFTPVRIGDKVLVDGGLRNNYPADIAKEMGADYIIGVTVQGPAKTADDLTSGTDVIGQIVDVNCKNKYDANLALTDIAIRVNPKPFGTTSFTVNAIDSLIRRGEEEAMKHWDELMALKKRLGIAEGHVNPRPSLYPAVAQAQEDSIVYEDDRLPDYDRLKASIGLRFDTEEMVAMQIDADYQKKDSPWNFDATIRLGKRMMGKMGIGFNPVGMAKMKFSYIFNHNDINQYDGGEREFNATYNYHAADFRLMDFNIRNFNINIGARWDYYHVHDVLLGKKATEMVIHFGDEHYFRYYLTTQYNSENTWNFPTRGAKFQAGYAYFTDNFVKYHDHIGFSVVDAMWRMSFRWTPRLTFQPMAYGRLLFGSDIPLTQINLVGGEWFGHYMDQQMPFAGVGYMERANNSFVALQLRFQEQLTERNFILLKVVGAEDAERLSKTFDQGPMLGYQLSYYYNSLFGPLGATLGYSNRTDRVSFYINLGFEF